LIEQFILKVKHAETPFYRRLKSVAVNVQTGNLPLPDVARPFFRMLYYLQAGLASAWLRFTVYFFISPVFRGRCTSVGKRLLVTRMPFVVGPTKIHIGDDVRLFGKVDVFSGRIFDNPTLILKDRVDLGANVSFVVNKEIIIEEDVNVASGVRFMDTDSHPRDMEARIADLGPPPEEIKPVRVCRNAWIGQNCFILKGVTVGEGAIIGVNSVVVSDIPAYSVAMGNPARVIIKDSRKAGV
jgi:acetyltransferase-like isoleucine patch superfamily enzyme